MSQLQTFDRQNLRDDPSIRARLRDGGVATLRPLGPGETEPLLAVFSAMSGDSRARRYLTGMPRLPGQMLRMLADVDGERHVAWLASVDGEPAGIARYVRLDDFPSTAEVAFEVVDRHHGRGLATVLLDVITTVAAAKGVRTVQATTDPGNVASQRLVTRVGASTRLVSGLVEAEGPLHLLEHATVDRGAVVRLACAGRSAVEEGTLLDRAV